MGSLLGVARERGGGFTEGLKQRQLEQGVDRDEEKVQGRGHTHHEEIEGSPAPPPCIHSLSSRCQPRQGQPLQKPFPDGLPNDAESFLQLVQENEKYKRLYKEMEERYCALIDENETQRQYIIEKKDEEIFGLQHDLQKLKWHHDYHIHALNEKVKEHQQNCRDLSLKIERAEHLHSQQSMADSGSYQDSAATPPLLQDATDSVKNAITAFASELFSRIKKNSLRINCVRMNVDSKETGQIIKVALQSFLCNALFKGFEDPFFCASDGIPLFLKPASRKALLFQGYKRCRDSDARQMLNEETEFSLFFGVKESELCKQLRKELLMTDDVQKTEDFITSELCSRNTNLHSKLLRLVKAVCLLHKLAFSFEPSAEIIRVGQGSVLDDEFMEDVAGDDDEDDNEEEIFAERFTRVKKVTFMCVPGFIVRHTIIKARVFCLGRSERRICSQTEDPSPMTLG